jgi:5-(carboxyamino)imidazole ribonucleotide mutase
MKKVAIVMGSDSDLETMQPAIDICKEFEIPHLVRVLSAHRTPFEMMEFGKNAADNDFGVIIAGAGGAAHLPGMLASSTVLPVIGVPVKTKTLSGLDSLYSIVQMPGGVPVATVAIDGGKNAGLLAAQILAVSEPMLHKKMQEYKSKMAEESRAKNNNTAFGDFSN